MVSASADKEVAEKLSIDFQNLPEQMSNTDETSLFLKKKMLIRMWICKEKKCIWIQSSKRHDYMTIIYKLIRCLGM